MENRSRSFEPTFRQNYDVELNQMDNSTLESSTIKNGIARLPEEVVVPEANIYTNATPLAPKFFVNTHIPSDETGRNFIVSNRLPVTIDKTVSTYTNGDGIPRQIMTAKPSVGGLATGMNSALKDGQKRGAWIGWDGTVIDQDKQHPSEIIEEREGLEEALRTLNDNGIYDIAAVRLTKKEEDLYYSGYANGVLWEWCHDMLEHATYDFKDPSTFQEAWDVYQSVNKKFAQAAIETTSVGDNVWVQDYHLLLMGKDMREMNGERKDQNINFFLHIPFPSTKSFVELPEDQRKLIIEGLLHYNTAGFQTAKDVDLFIQAVKMTLPEATFDTDSEGRAIVNYAGRKTVAADFPISIDAEAFETISKEEKTLEFAEKHKVEAQGKQIIFDVARLDPSKGVTEKFQAFDQTLTEHPELVGEFALMQVIAPGRLNVPAYRKLFDQIHDLTEAINAKHGTEAIILKDKGIRNQHELVGLYQAGKIGMVTPRKDGMNLVMKEAIMASKPNTAFIFGEGAGASQEFIDQALLVDGQNIGLMAQVLYQAMMMPEQELVRRNLQMKEHVRKFDVFHWVKQFKKAAGM